MSKRVAIDGPWLWELEGDPWLMLRQRVRNVLKRRGLTWGRLRIATDQELLELVGFGPTLLKELRTVVPAPNVRETIEIVAPMLPRVGGGSAAPSEC